MSLPSIDAYHAYLLDGDSNGRGPRGTRFSFSVDRRRWAMVGWGCLESAVMAAVVLVAEAGTLGFRKENALSLASVDAL